MWKHKTRRCNAKLPTLSGNRSTTQEIKRLINLTYRSSKNLAEATLKIVNSLFGKYGLIIIDGNSSDKTVEVAKKNSCKVIIQKERYNGIPKVRSFYDGLKILLAMIKLFFRK